MQLIGGHKLIGGWLKPIINIFLVFGKGRNPREVLLAGILLMLLICGQRVVTILVRIIVHSGRRVRRHVLRSLRYHAALKSGSCSARMEEFSYRTVKFQRCFC